MSYESDLALLAAGSYWDIRQDDNPNTPTIDESNRDPLPAGWKVLQFDKSDSGPTAVTGFSARVYQNTSTNEIVISYAGTEFDTASLHGTLVDFSQGNTPLAVGSYGSQAYRAAALYQEVKAAGLTSNITFTGHSLGGGLASMMAVWFNRPAYVYAPAPFQASADRMQLADDFDIVNGELITIPANQIRVLPLVKAELLRKTGFVDPDLVSYNPSADFLIRERNVQAWAVDGELLRKTLFALNWIEGTPATLLFNNPTNSLNFVKKHSIELHAAALMSTNFVTQASKIPDTVELIFNEQLYGYAVTKNQQNFLVKLLRNEVGIRRDDGTVLQAANGMLTHFANDLQKLGNNLTALSSAAQKAMIAQGIEWYYWQSNNYTGAREFFTQTGSLLQYTTAIGDSLTGALNKAVAYTRSWLSTVQGAYSVPNTTVIRVDYEQWNVVAGHSGTTATALASGKSQIFITGNGADTLTGGDMADTFFAGNGLNTVTGGGGNDTIYGGADKDIQDGGADSDTLYGGAGDDELTGGTGNDTLQGGAGNDTYKCADGWGNDVITDSDGKGTIKFGDKTLGTAKGAGQANVWVAELGAGSGQFVGMTVYKDSSSSTGKKLLITEGVNTGNTITINNFDQSAAEGAGYLGIKLKTTQEISITQGNGTTQGASTANVVADRNFKTSSLEGKETKLNEGTGAGFTVSLAVGAKAGDTVTLAVNGALSGKLKARVNGALVDASGATITLKEGQTLASFDVVNDSAIDADIAGGLSATYSGAESATSNNWNVTVKDAGETTATFEGDYNVKTQINNDSTRRRSCVKSERMASKRYAFNSCLHHISLDCRNFRLKFKIQHEFQYTQLWYGGRRGGVAI
jgi:Ca2+-binding RTX toxin-like protein